MQRADRWMKVDDTVSALETFSDSGLYKFTFYIYSCISVQVAGFAVATPGQCG